MGLHTILFVCRSLCVIPNTFCMAHSAAITWKIHADHMVSHSAVPGSHVCFFASKRESIVFSFDSVKISITGKLGISAYMTNCSESAFSSSSSSSSHSSKLLLSIDADSKLASSSISSLTLIDSSSSSLCSPDTSEKSGLARISAKTSSGGGTSGLAPFKTDTS